MCGKMTELTVGAVDTHVLGVGAVIAAPRDLVRTLGQTGLVPGTADLVQPDATGSSTIRRSAHSIRCSP